MALLEVAISGLGHAEDLGHAVLTELEHLAQFLETFVQHRT